MLDAKHRLTKNNTAKILWRLTWNPFDKKITLSLNFRVKSFPQYNDQSKPIHPTKHQNPITFPHRKLQQSKRIQTHTKNHITRNNTPLKQRLIVSYSTTRHLGGALLPHCERSFHSFSNISRPSVYIYIFRLFPFRF